MSKNLRRLSEPEARALLEAVRWPKGPICPFCAKADVVAVKGGREGLKRCRKCRKQFTVTVDTIFERSHIPLADWVYAFAAMCSSKKGVSAHQLHRELGCTYKTAWFMCHRIREALRSDVGILGTPGGHVEVDETWVGGKPRKGGPKNKSGIAPSKTPVIALVERGGKLKARTIVDVTAKTLRPLVMDNVHGYVTLHTDELGSYHGLKHEFEKHLKVSHSQGQYAKRNGAGINTVESWFALLKRGVYGTFHNVSRKHLDRYCDEFAFRWNHRKVKDSERTIAALSQVSGKRLTYRATE